MIRFVEDIGFFKGRETFAGVSVATLFSSLLCSLIIWLYLLDGDGASSYGVM